MKDRAEGKYKAIPSKGYEVVFDSAQGGASQIIGKYKNLNEAKRVAEEYNKYVRGDTDRVDI